MELARAEFSSIESLCGIHFGTEMSNPLWCSHRLIIAGEEVTDLVIPNSIASIGNCSFVGGIYISSITIPNSVKSIGHYAFSFCEGLTSVKIPSSVIEIGQGAFAYCSGLSSIEIPTSVTMIERSTFKYCSNLSCINLPESITGIGRSAFEGCSTLTSIIIPKSLTSIGQESFKSCENLDTIIMGPNIKDLEYQCFIGCPVSNIYITAPFPPETYDPFDSYSAVLHLQGKASIEAYQADEVWSKFKRELMVEASDLRIEGESYVSGNPGETFQLKADIYPADVTLPYIYWRSTNPRIATVDSDGLVTLLGDDDEEETRAEEANSRDNSCKIIAESLYYDGPIAEVTVYNSDFNGVETVMDEWTEGGIDYMLPYELYNLSGAKVEDSVDGLGKGIYILRQGKHAVKIAVK